MQTANLTDHFLIAMPTLDDPNFAQTVTYICSHSKNGAMGLVINRPLGVDLEDLYHQMAIAPQVYKETNQYPLYQGGPVEPERGFVIHQPIGKWASMVNLADNLAMTTSRDIIEAFAHGDGPQMALVMLGYAGWEAGQLEQELADNTWLSGPADHAILFETPVAQRWQMAAQHIGVDLSRLSTQVGHC